MNSIYVFILGFLVSSFIFSFIFIIKLKSLSKENFELKTANINLTAKYSAIQNIQEIIKKDFVQLANETIKSEQEDLRKQNRESLEEKLLPLARELNEFKDKIEKFNISGVENTTKIVDQINNLEKNNKLIEKEARSLVDALTKNQNVKGSYGEDLLEKILEYVGFVEGIHYSKQLVSTSENLLDDKEHSIRPDFVLNLPNSHHLIIDSKVTLTSYLEYMGDNSKLKTFKSEVKRRILDLANKNYQNAYNISQPDFVLMYMPIESSVSLIYEDLDLVNLAYKSNVIVVGTSALLTTIRMVNYLISQQKQNENVQKIVNLGTNLYDTFVSFCDDLVELQKRFDDINLKFGTTINRFKRGKSLFKQVELLKEYGINSNKQIKDKFLSDTLQEEVK